MYIIYAYRSSAMLYFAQVLLLTSTQESTHAACLANYFHVEAIINTAAATAAALLARSLIFVSQLILPRFDKTHNNATSVKGHCCCCCCWK